MKGVKPRTSHASSRPLALLVCAAALYAIAPPGGVRGDEVPGSEGMRVFQVQTGPSRVLVQLRLSLTDAELSDVELRSKAIARAREAMLGELAGTSYRVLRTYDTIPFVALEASSDTLMMLQQSPAVVGIEPDGLSSPQGPGGGPPVPGS
jgi:hypothetical protein